MPCIVLRVRAAHRGRSIGATIHDILESAVRPPERVKLDSLPAAIAREANGLTDKEHALIERVRDRTLHPVRLPVGVERLRCVDDRADNIGRGARAGQNQVADVGKAAAVIVNELPALAVPLA